MYIYKGMPVCVWVRLFLFHFPRESNTVSEEGKWGEGVVGGVVNVSCALYSH